MDVDVLKITCGTAVATIVSYLIWRRLRSPPKKEYPRDTVILHQIGRGPHAPSLTPFAVKLETYLRMAKIPYMNVHDKKRSKKGKFPWIEYNGEEIADSEFCIEFLNKQLGIDLNKNFTTQERGIARAFQSMYEDNFYWILVIDRWQFDESYTIQKIFGIPFFMRSFVRSRLKKVTHAVGLGRHSKEEVYHIMNIDLKALSDFLGQKKFLLGDSPCQEDCAVFGQLAEFYWQGFGSEAEAILKSYKNLCDYCERMKDKFWPDWDKCNTKGGTQEATK